MHNTHMPHLEDLLLQGTIGAWELVTIIRGVKAALNDEIVHHRRHVDLTVKWDGSPALVTGRDPMTDKFFLATKSKAFSKVPKLAYSLEDIATIYGETTLADEFSALFVELEKLKIRSVVQGDLLFTRFTLQPGINDETVHSFTPNTITYGVPKDTPLADRVDAANVGVVFHTSYTGTGPLHTHTALYGYQTEASSTKLFTIDPTYRRRPQILIPEVARELDLYAGTLEALIPRVTSVLTEMTTHTRDYSFGYMFKLWVNHLIRTRQYNNGEMLPHFVDFMRERILTKASEMKQESSRLRYERMWEDLSEWIALHSTALWAFCTLYANTVEVKEILLTHLGALQLPGIIPYFAREGSYVPTAHEGYVAHLGPHAVKLVNRKVFSAENFIQDETDGE